MRALLCNPLLELISILALYLIGVWLLTHSFITRCLAAIGKPFPRFAFCFTFYGVVERGPWSTKRHEFPLWGMTDEDMKIVIAYRQKFLPLLIGLTIIFAISFIGGISMLQNACRS